MTEREKIVCPYCGYRMPIERDRDAQCRGIYVRCKGRSCGRIFEIKIEKQPDR